MTATGPIVTCARCGRPRRHFARGLCGTCYRARTTVRGTHGRIGSQTSPPDEVVVQRVIAGDWMPMNMAERRAVVAEMTRRGFSASEIARQTRLAPRTVTRHRTALRGAA